MQSSDLPAISCFIAIFFELVNYEQLEDLRNAWLNWVIDKRNIGQSPQQATIWWPHLHAVSLYLVGAHHCDVWSARLTLRSKMRRVFTSKRHHGGTHTFQGVKWAEPCRGKKNRSRPRRVGAHLNTPKNDVFSPEIYSFRVTLFCTLICVCIHHSLESTKGERQPWPTRIQCLVSWVSWVSEPERHTRLLTP